jgi:hypothetical protein
MEGIEDQHEVSLNGDLINSIVGKHILDQIKDQRGLVSV